MKTLNGAENSSFERSKNTQKIPSSELNRTTEKFEYFKVLNWEGREEIAKKSFNLPKPPNNNAN